MIVTPANRVSKRKGKCEDYLSGSDVSHPLLDLQLKPPIPINEPGNYSADKSSSSPVLGSPNDQVISIPETKTNCHFKFKNQFKPITTVCIATLVTLCLVAGVSLVANYRKSSSDIPESLDYRVKGIVTPIKDELNCHAGAYYAAVACLESKHAQLTGKVIDLSEQHLLDCSKGSRNNTCKGGSLKSILNFLRNSGVDMEANNRYAENGTRECGYPERKYEIRILEWKSIDQDEEAMKIAIFQYGPIIASLTVDDAFRSYDEGVFTARSNGTSNHAVLIVGYGHENGTDVWYVKNSWGKDWGDKGFMTMQRNVNLRGIAEEPYVIVTITDAGSGGERNFSAGFYALCFVATINAVYGWLFPK